MSVAFNSDAARRRRHDRPFAESFLAHPKEIIDSDPFLAFVTLVLFLFLVLESFFGAILKQVMRSDEREDD